jgi:hypothetical protein
MRGGGAAVGREASVSAALECYAVFTPDTLEEASWASSMRCSVCRARHDGGQRDRSAPVVGVAEQLADGGGEGGRFIQSVLRECAYARAYRRSGLRIAALGAWIRYYNRERPHMGIRGLSPQQRLRSLVNNVPVNDS